jgi:RNA polymerase primary sigma factor
VENGNTIDRGGYKSKPNEQDSLRQFKITTRITTRNGKASLLYVQDVAKTKVMTPDEENEVGKLAAAGDEKAQKKLVEANLRFVLSVAKMYSQDPIIIEDLIQAGNIGLVDSSRKFDPSRGFKFISFAVWHIRKEMLLFLSQNSRTIRIPENKNQVLGKVREAQTQLLGILGREPNEEEILQHMHGFDHQMAKKLDLDTLKVLLSIDNKVSSLDHQFGSDDQAGTLLDVLADEDGSFDSDYDRDHYLFYINTALAKLTERERQTITQHLDLNGTGYTRSFFDISQEWGLSPESVRVIYRKGLRKLKFQINRMKNGRNGLFS